MNLIENEDLAREHFEKAVANKDIATCYDMSLKDFEHSDVHDLFKVCNFICLVFVTLYFFLSNCHFCHLPFYRQCQNSLRRLGRP